MKRLLILLMLTVVSIGFCFAGPFGLENGMTLEQLTEACGGIEPERIEDDDRYMILPEKSHSTFN